MENFDWVGTLVNWIPMALIAAVWLFFFRKIGRGPYTMYQIDSFELQKRQADALERIAAALEKRSS